MNRLFVSAGPAFVVLYSGGMILVQFFPPTNPQDSAAKVTHFFSDHKTALGIGCILMEFGAAFIAVWAVAIAAQPGKPYFTSGGKAGARLRLLKTASFDHRKLGGVY